MSSPQDGPSPVHRDDASERGNTVADDAASDTGRQTDDIDSNNLVPETKRTGEQEPDAPPTLIADRRSPSRRSTDSDQSRVAPEMTSPTLSPVDVENGVTGEGNTEDSEPPTLPHTLVTPAAPVAQVPQPVPQTDTTQSSRIGWPSTRERSSTAYSRVRSRLDRQDEFYETGSPLYAPSTHPPRSSTGRRTSQDSHGALTRRGVTAAHEVAPPRWQPDAEVTYCPICRAQFSFFIRKHHCRKCGRVVCAACSPHRIIIPHQYIVRAPGSEIVAPPIPGYFESNNLSGGERVRLCNPCVPDPNTAPPQSPSSSIGPNLPSHHRSRSSLAGLQGATHPSNRYGAVFTGMDDAETMLRLSSRARSITLDPAAQSSVSTVTSAHHMSAPDADDREAFHRLLRRFHEVRPVSSSRARHASIGYDSSASSSRQRALPPPPPHIAEEDECPVCHGELPARSLPDFESLREAHINACVQSHSTYGSPRRRHGEDSAPAPRRSGMHVYPATEKDCVDDAECTICLEEFVVGVPMARLECLCRFHRSCISAWFVNHPGRCPVHQHDGFGF
ncbi:hypothetical protein E4U36_001586 [Claviceps purpurea]|nr:hypothetical protein E4U37_001429 [Claviceps purpurea]KAG6185002.1 hypothetical protein E4U36_001586 [Claviceps purpurea]